MATIIIGQGGFGQASTATAIPKIIETTRAPTITARASLTATFTAEPLPTITPPAPTTTPLAPTATSLLITLVPLSEIDQKYLFLGGEGSILGPPIGREQSTPDGQGRFRKFEGGYIYWTPNTGAHEVHGYIRDKWEELGMEASFLGYPITDELIAPDGVGRYNHFEGGSIYWTPNTGAHEVHGYIRDKWEELGWEQSCLGYPISDEEPSSAGWIRQSRFEHGIIKWTPDQGAVERCY